jgi:cation-transporting ATPase 13A3/4/5
VPFVITIVVAVLFSAYLLLDPVAGLARFMQLTFLSLQFKVFLLALVTGGFLFAWMAERRIFMLVAKAIGSLHDQIWPQRRKKRKQYKLLLEKMRM